MRNRFFFLSFLIGFSFLSYSQEPFNGDDEKMLIKNEIERYKHRFVTQQATLADERYDVTYYKLDVMVTTSPQYIRGSVLMKAFSKLDGLSTITIDMMNSLTVDSVKVGSTTVGFTQQSSSFDVTLDRAYNLDEEIAVTMYYRGVPGNSGFGSFEFSSHSGTPWVWSLSEPYGAKDWWPCKDHPNDKADSADIFVTCSSAYKVGSNGKLLDVVDNGNSTSTHHWKESYAIPTYLISIAITNYAQFSNWFHYSPTDSMEVLNYVLPEHLSSAQANLPRTVDMLEIYSDMFGLYPFITEKYGHSEFGWGGGMEHQTMTSLGGFSEGLVAHELAHQWFGDMITCRNWPNIWLNEGFATYLTALYYEQKYGSSSYWGEMTGEMNSAKTAVGSIYVADTNNIGNLFSGSLVYAKGATVLHMLRHVIGDTAFFTSMFTYANDPRYKYGTAVTEDFQAICEVVSGKDLDYFFSEWIYGEKYPKYMFGWSAQPVADGYEATINISQTTGTSNPTFFTMPVDIKFSASGWDTTITVFNNQQIQSFTVTLSHEPTSAQLDPNNWILKDFTKAFSATPSSLTFGTVNVGTSKTLSVTVRNNGVSTMTFSSVASDMVQYTVTPSTGSLVVGDSLKFDITFTPTGDGSKIGHIIFTHNLGTPDQITATAFGLWPRYTHKLFQNWNLVSLPVKPADPRKATIFSTASSAAFAFEGISGYVAKDSLFESNGYWIKYNSETNVTFMGYTRNTDTVEVTAGWNLVGSLTKAISVVNVVTDPSGILASDFFGYNVGYAFSDSLKPSKGYWVKVSQDGKLILQSVVVTGARNIGTMEGTMERKEEAIRTTRR